MKVCVDRGGEKWKEVELPIAINGQMAVPLHVLLYCLLSLWGYRNAENCEVLCSMNISYIAGYE
jgi:hypothetical protein